MFRDVKEVSGVKIISYYLSIEAQKNDGFPVVVIYESLIDDSFSIEFLFGNKSKIRVRSLHTANHMAEIYINDLK